MYQIKFPTKIYSDFAGAMVHDMNAKMNHTTYLLNKFVRTPKEERNDSSVYIAVEYIKSFDNLKDILYRAAGERGEKAYQFNLSKVILMLKEYRSSFRNPIKWETGGYDVTIKKYGMSDVLIMLWFFSRFYETASVYDHEIKMKSKQPMHPDSKKLLMEVAELENVPVKFEDETLVITFKHAI